MLEPVTTAKRYLQIEVLETAALEDIASVGHHQGVPRRSAWDLRWMILGPAIRRSLI